MLKRFGITIDLGRVHNPNKNPIAENAVKEFLKERLRLKPEGGPITDIERCIIMMNMNQRIRNRGLAPKEIFLRRDLTSNEVKHVNDEELSAKQTEIREKGHPINEKCKATYQKKPDIPDVKVGDNVYIRNDLSKLRAREQYTVVQIFEQDSIKWALLQKSESQLRSKRYKVKLSEIMPVPFGSNTVKEVPEIVFSQEMTPLHGFPVSDEQQKENDSCGPGKRKVRVKVIQKLKKIVQKLMKGKEVHKLM